MRKNFLLNASTLLAALLIAGGASAQKKFIPVGKAMIDGQMVNTFVKAPGNVPVYDRPSNKSEMKKSVSLATTLVNEDFSKMTKGSEDEPDTVTLCSFYGIDGADYYIPEEYTNAPGWTGDNIFQAGGMIAARSHNVTTPAVLNSPLGDFSGKLVVTFRVKPISTSTVHIFVNMLDNGIESPTVGEGEDLLYNVVNVYPNQGWHDVTVDMTKYQATPDAFLQLCIYGDCVIDDIKINATYPFIAAPVMKEITDVTDSSFTANWYRVHKAYDYRAKLYKKNWITDGDTTVVQDFEGDVPENWIFGGNAHVEEGIGQDNSKGVVLCEGDTITSPDFGSVLRNLTCWLNLTADDDANVDNTYLMLEYKVDGVWRSLGYYKAAYFKNKPDVINMAEEAANYFPNKASQLRIYMVNAPESAKLYVDNYNITSARMFEYEEVGSEKIGIKTLSYTFTDLDPAADYAYSVKAHYMYQESEEIINGANVIAAPLATDATDVDERGGYTANWNPVTKATGYIVSNYGVTNVEADGEATILEEDFAKIDASVTDATSMVSGEKLGNSDVVSFDDYTTIPGWTGQYNTLVQSGLGTTAGYVATPLMYLANADKYYLTIKIYGYYGDKLYIVTPNNTYSFDFQQDPSDTSGMLGVLEGIATVPESGEDYSIKFLSAYGSYGYPMTIDYVKVSQDMKAGDKVYTLLSQTEVSADETNCRISGLSDYDFTTYAYSVQSVYNNGFSTVTSTASNKMLLNLDGSDPYGGTTGISAAEKANTISDVYSANGTKLQKFQKGVNIVKMSDGSVRKVMIK